MLCECCKKELDVEFVFLGSVGRFAIIDNEDLQIVSQYKWHYNNGYAATRIDGCIVFMHSLLIGKPINGYHTDHINGQRLDNRRANLRICTAAQNQWNTLKGSGFSKYRGVKYDKQGKRWVSRIQVNKKLHYLGSFKSEIAAATAYQKALRKLCGEYAPKYLPLIDAGQPVQLPITTAPTDNGEPQPSPSNPLAAEA